MNRTNSKAITSLTLGILSIVIPYLGVVLGIIGIVMGTKALREPGETGRGLAVAGRVCSIVGVCIQGLVLAFAILGFALLARA